MPLHAGGALAKPSGLQGVLTAAPLEEAVRILDRKWHAYFRSSEPWSKRNPRLARITERRSNDVIPDHKVPIRSPGPEACVACCAWRFVCRKQHSTYLRAVRGGCTRHFIPRIALLRSVGCRCLSQT